MILQKKMGPLLLYLNLIKLSIYQIKLIKKTKQLIAKKGDVIFLDAMLYHRAGENLTSKDRNLIVNMFTLPFVKPQLNYSKMLKNLSKIKNYLIL